MNAFVSLSHHDVEFVSQRILPVLSAAGVTPWIYEATIPGDNWVESVMRQIRDGDWFVVALTEHYQESIKFGRGACYTELLWIVEHLATSRRRSRLIVVWCSGEIPELLRTWQAIDVRSDMNRLQPALHSAAAADRKSATPPEVPPADGLSVDIQLPRDINPFTLPDLARFNFNNNARQYFRSLAAGKPMQRDNGEVLLAMFSNLMQEGKVRRPEAWLDAGCGTGLMAYLFDDLKERAEFSWMRECSVRAGFDYAPGMLNIINALNTANGSGEWYTHTFEADLRHFGSDTLLANIHRSRVDLIVANNVFHWLFSEDMIERVLGRLYEVLDRNGGCLAASIAAVGTGSGLFGAYQKEVSESLTPSERDRWSRHLANPIGLQSVDSIVDTARRCRFKIERARQVYEPKVYESTDEYVRDVRAYGEEVLMAPLLGKSRDEREQIWKRIADRFRDLHQAKFNQRGYIHNQFVIYLLAVRHD